MGWSWACVLAVVAAPFVAGAQGKTPAPKREALLAASREVITAARYATMVTNGLDGQPSARIVDPFAPDADLTV